MKLMLLGPPGAGKGTQAEFLCKHFSIPQISTGDMLREAVTNGDEIGQQLADIMQSGELVPDALIVQIVQARIVQEDCANGFLLDGFPRTIPQAEALDEARVQLDAVIEITVSEEMIVERMSGRRVHPASGRVYHLEYNPPQREGLDDVTGEPLLQRDDDQRETVLNRLAVYHQQTSPLINFYKSKNISMRYLKIDGSKTVEEVREQIFKQL